MFSNRFNNTKNDPLLGAVEGALKEGAMRRQAEAIVNEEFGVYSRKAVVREKLAAYDARLEEAYKCMKEGKPNDGNLANNYPPYDKVTRGDVIAGRLGKDQMGGKKNVKEGSMYNGKNPFDPKDPSVQGSGDVTSTPAPKPMARKAPNDPSVQGSGDVTMRGKPARVQEDQLDELKQSTIRSYIDKAHAKASAAKSAGFKKDFTEKKGKKAASARHEFSKRTHGLEHAGKRLREEEQIDEISKEMVGRYIHKNAKEREHLAGRDEKLRVARDSVPAGLGHSRETSDLGWKMRQSIDKETEGVRKAQWKRSEGMHTAVKKLTGKAKVSANEETMNEAAYSAKAARAGKDIGKPGKMFAKIAAKAGERYGSEERGKKVAGAILKRIRAKHLEEVTYTPGTQGVATGSSFAAIDRARNAPMRSAPRPPARPSDTALNKLSRNRSLADSGSKYAAGKPHSVTTLAPTAPGAQGKVQSRTTEKGWADPGRWENEAKAKTGSMQQIRQGKVLPPSSELGTPKGGESSTQSFLNKELGRTTSSAQGSETPTSTSAPKNVPTPPRKPESLTLPTIDKGPSVPAAGMPNPKVSAPMPPKRPGSLAESIQVGENKYRIV